MQSIQTGIKIIETLEKNKHKAFFVGGAVRDHLLKVSCEDIDIATSAKPFVVMKYFETVPTGLKYGTMTVKVDGQDFEVTTFRVDGPTNDFRHPSSVVYTNSEVDDVKRRDFTINGLLMDKRMNIIDYVGGRDDLNNKIIRAIGNADERFKEDALRILRGFYFVSKLDFDIEPNTLQAMSYDRNLLDHIANERILAELIKIMKANRPQKAFRYMVQAQVHKNLPGLEKGIEFVAQASTMPYIDVFFVASFILNGGIIPDAWRFSNQQRQKYQQATTLALSNKPIGNKELYQYGITNCVLANKALAYLDKAKYAEKQITELYEQLPLKSELDLKLSADETILAANKKPAAWLGKFRSECVLLILDGQLKNTKEDLLKHLKEFLGEK